MPCGAILTFDQQTDQAVRGLWQVIDDAGLPSAMLSLNYPPHVTLLACDDIDLDGLQRGPLPGFLAEHQPLVVDFPGLGVFPGPQPVVYLTLTRSPGLSALHAAFWEIARPYALGLNRFYQPDSWVPHVTLNHAPAPEKTGAVIQALFDSPLPARGLLLYLQVVDLDNGVTSIFNQKLGAINPGGKSI